MSYKEFSDLSVCPHSPYIDISAHMKIYEYTYCMLIYIYIYTLIYPFPFSIIFFRLLSISLPHGRKVLSKKKAKAQRSQKQNWYGKQKKSQNCRGNYWWCFPSSDCPTFYPPTYSSVAFIINFCLLIIPSFYYLHYQHS